jgi:hypothetical protein
MRQASFGNACLPVLPSLVRSLKAVKNHLTLLLEGNFYAEANANLPIRNPMSNDRIF